MFFLLSKILDFFITPLSWILICILLSFVVKNAKVKTRLRKAVVILLLIFTNPWLVEKVTYAWEMKAYSSEEIKTPYDVGIVLGGSMRYYDPVSKRVVYSLSVDRLLQSLQLYHDGKIKKILLSGGSGYVNFKDWKESKLIAEVLLKSGVPAADMILENESRNTYENAIHSAEMLSDGKNGTKFLLITSAFHMRRSLMCFEKAGLKVVDFPVDTRSAPHIHTLDKIIQPDAECLSQWDMLLHEWIGLVMYKMMGYC
ncbi:MAG: YdcF family protein [Bacteroidetes bacterium]|jgi:uncharacterized SAM-binding protein YcdF (DUF218 family)|nr:YdcF family protein [Bacteroidota bacterium]